MRVKVCGITTVQDALEAAEEGAAALGFNFYPGSPRYVAPDSARDITARLPPFVTPVGVFVNAGTPQEVELMARRAGVSAIQLHGDESAEFCLQLASWPVIRAVRIGARPVAEVMEPYPVRALLLDYRDDENFGGTGRTLDWEALSGRHWPLPVILAGGLRPDNLRSAIRSVRPWAVDVCSGVEASPGRKDRGKLRAFMREVRDAIEYTG